MSASGSPQGFDTFEDVASQFPITPDEAQQIADALGPAQTVAGVGADIGSVLADSPGAGPQLVGALLQNLSVHLDLAAVSVETISRMVNFYIATQKETATEVFPPPSVAVQQAREDFRPLIELVRGGP